MRVVVPCTCIFDIGRPASDQGRAIDAADDHIVALALSMNFRANGLSVRSFIQGVMFATRLRQQWPKVPITEAHPKALIKFLNLDDRLDKYWTAVSAKFEIDNSMPTSPHESMQFLLLLPHVTA
jgi:hypothetical protein